MNLKEIKSTVLITDYLRAKGFLPVKIQGENFWYLSPLRMEHNASFKVNNRLNCWYDYGLGRGGNIVELVMSMYNLDSVSDVIRHFTVNTPPKVYDSLSFEQQKVCSGIRDLRVEPLRHPALVRYLQERGIPLNIARLYCRDVHFHTGGKPYFAVGFENDSGGYELRNRYFKGCTSKDITTFKQGSGECLVFEGFTDFLSYLVLKGLERTKQDVAVLNSVVTLSKAKDFLQAHETVYSFLDNDEAGKRTFLEMKSLCKQVSDQSGFYKNHKDLNEYLCHRNLNCSNKKSRGMKL